MAAMWRQCGSFAAAMWRRCGGDVVAMWQQCLAAIWRQRGIVFMSSLCSCHFVVMSSPCLGHVVATRLAGVVASLPSTSGRSLTEAFRL